MTRTWAGRLAAAITAELEYMRAQRTRMLAAYDIVVSHRTAEGIPLFLDAGDEEIAGIVAILRGGQEAGEFADMDVTVAARTVVHAIDAALTESQKDPQRHPGARVRRDQPRAAGARRLRPGAVRGGVENDCGQHRHVLIARPCRRLAALT